MIDAYFLYHSIGQYPGKAGELAGAMAEFAGVWAAADDAQWGYVLSRRTRFIDRWRQLINAPDGSLTTTDSVTQGLSMLMTALPAARLAGRRVVVSADCFPSNHFLLTKLSERLGFTLHTVPLRDGASYVEDEDVLAALGSDVGLVLATFISSTSSHRADLASLTAKARQVGALVGVDITQGAGLIPFDVSAPAVDFTLSTSLKWVCGTPGAGILHVAPALIAETRPELRGWFSQPNPFNWDLDRFAYAPDIRRFDNGTPSAMSALASLPALDWLLSSDRAAILATNRRHTTRLIDAAEDLGLTLATPTDPNRRGGSVMLRLNRDATPVVAALKREGIHTDNRGPLLRASPGVITTDAGVEALIDGLARYARG